MKEKIPTKDMTKYALEEARMVIPGIQALFGFQLIAVFNNRFTQLDQTSVSMHLMAAALTSISIAFLMAPASYHRQVEPESVSHELIKYAGKMICLGMFALLLSTSLDSYVVTKLATSDSGTATFAAIFVAVVPLFCWYVYPQIEKRHRRKVEEQLKMPSEDAAFVYRS